MEVGEINNKDVWEGFLEQCEDKTFLDSWNWGEFQKKIEEKIWRLGVYDEEELVSVALVVKVKAKRGTFLFVPHGPVVRSLAPRKELSSLQILLAQLKEIAKKEKASFIRVAPICLARRLRLAGGRLRRAEGRSPKGEGGERIFKELGFLGAPIHIHPEVTWELDISGPEEELLRGMRKTTRYLIRQAQKNPDIEILKSQNIEDLKKFNEIYSTTSRRHKFVPFSLNYLQNQFSSFLPDNISLFWGKYKGEIVSGAIVVFWQGIGFYHHGASLLKYNRIPVSYLLQWEAIKEAKKRGCKLYNFWGIAPENKKNHPWTGLTLFKTGFGGYKKEYVKTQDLPLSKGYWLTFIFEKIRKTKRGL